MIYYLSFIFSIVFLNCCVYSDEVVNLKGIHNSELYTNKNYNLISESNNSQIISNMELYCGVSNRCQQYQKIVFMKEYIVNYKHYQNEKIIVVNLNNEINIKRISFMFARYKYIVLLYYKYKFYSILQSSIIYNINDEIKSHLDEIIHACYIFITDKLDNKILWIGKPTILITSENINVEKGILYCNSFKELYNIISIIEFYPNIVYHLQNDLSKHLLSHSYVFNQKKIMNYNLVIANIKEELKLINNSSSNTPLIYININSHSFISLPSNEMMLCNAVNKYIELDMQYSIIESILVRLLHISSNNDPKIYELFISIVNQTDNSNTKLVYLYTHLLCSLEKKQENVTSVAKELNKHFMSSLEYELYCDMVNFTYTKKCYNGVKYYSSFFDNVKESKTHKYIDLLIKMKYFRLNNIDSYNISFYIIINRLEKAIELFPLNRIVYTCLNDLKMRVNNALYPNKYTAMISIASKNEYDYFCKYKNRITIPDGKKLLIFYITENNIWFKPFGPSLLGEFLGGSEESLIEIANELAENGYWVEVYCDIKLSDQFKPKFTESGGCLIWYPIECLKLPLKNTRNLLLFVMFRSLHSIYLVDEDRYYKTVIWLKDEPKWSNNSTWLLSYIDYVIIQSEFHKSLLNNIYHNRSYLINVQLYTKHLELPLRNKNNIFIYASQPSRGLDSVLKVWNYIHEKIQNSELHIFYDFHDNFIKYLQTQVDDTIINNFLYVINTLPGVILHGGANQDELSHFFSKAGFLLYPTSYPEVGCITCLKAMSYGCIPITSMYNKSVLPEITKQFDLGCEMNDDNDFLNKYTARILEAVNMNLTEKRIKMKKWINEKFSIKNTIKVWKKLINDAEISLKNNNQ